MPRIEVDEESWQQGEKLKSTLVKMMADPEAALMVERALKKVDPEAKTPRLDAQKPVEDRFDALTKNLTDLQKQLADDKTDREQQDKLRKLNANWQEGRKTILAEGYTEDGLKAVEELMEKEGIVNHKAGLAYFERLHPPQAPSTPSGSGAWNFLGDLPTEGDDDIKKLIESRGQNEPLADKMARVAVNEIRNQMPRR